MYFIKKIGGKDEERICFEKNCFNLDCCVMNELEVMKIEIS